MNVNEKEIKVECLFLSSTHAKYHIKYLAKGFALTMGNSFNRILLNSMQEYGNPVKKVEFSIDEETEHENLTFDIWTNDLMEPDKLFKIAAKKLMNYFEVIESANL